MRRYREPVLLILPAILVMVLIFFIPVGRMILTSFEFETESGETEIGIGNYERFFEDDYYLRVLYRTFKLAIIQTILCILIGFPMAYVMTRVSVKVRVWLMVLVVLPLMTSVVIRTFGWVVLLGRGSPLIDALYDLGLAERNFQLLRTEEGIVIAMVQVLLPFLTLNVLGVMLQIDPQLEEAARTMGSGFFKTLWHVTLPLSLPGVVSGSLLVFTLSISSFITPTLVGGVRLPVLASSVFQQATSVLNWEFAAAQSVLLLLAVLVVIIPYIHILRRSS